MATNGKKQSIGLTHSAKGWRAVGNGKVTDYHPTKTEALKAYKALTRKKKGDSANA